jgi:hypothetical protein
MVLAGGVLQKLSTHQFTIDTDIDVASLNTNISPVYLPNMNIPAMTGNTTPSGIANSSGYTGAYYPYLAFDQLGLGDSSTWRSNTVNSGWLSYDYGTNKLIKRYYIRSTTASPAATTFPISWNFEGWNGSSWDILEAKSAMGTSVSTGYTSALLTHTTQYSLYRIIVLNCFNTSWNPTIATFEMTESTGTIYGAITGGSFTVPSSLVGTRNITQTGNGIVCSSGTVLTTLHNNGSIVNFHTTTGNYIINPNWFGLAATANAIIHNGTAGGVINFNGDRKSVV